MNSNNQIQHLSYDELLIAVVDRIDLPAERQVHLDSCPGCQQTLTRTNRRLTHLGQLATQMAPKPSRTFRLPVKSTYSLRWMPKPSWIMAVAVTLLLAITILHPQWLTGPGKQKESVIDLSADRRLMVEVNALVDNALPAAYQQVASLSEPLSLDDANVDEDLMDWVVPSIEEDDNNDDSLS